MDAPRPDPASGQYFDPRPAAASAEREVEVILPEGALLRFVTDRATFSPDRLDPGTRVLLAEAPAPAGTTLADVGCGWGALTVALARRAPEATVWAVDVNERARALCRLNADRLGVGDRVRVVAPEEVPDDLAVDTIWSNPPIRIGKAALHDLLATWLGRLRPGGTAELVVHRHLGADSLARWLAGGGRAVTRRATHGGYRVLAVRAGAPA